MKAKPFLLLIFMLITAFSCEQINNLLTFYVRSSTSVTFPSSSPLSLPFEFMTPNIESDSSQEYEKYNTSVDLVKDVKLDELRLTITSPNGKTFSFLESVYIYISAENEDEILLASKENITSEATSIELITSQENLDAYIKAPSYTLRTKAFIRETLTSDVDIRINLKFKVKADVL